MKKWMFRVACLLALASPFELALPPSPAQAVVATTKYTLTTSTWTDLGVGPVLVSAAGRVVFAVADTTPSLAAEGMSVLPGSSFTFNTSSHVWAMSIDGISPFVYASPILASGGGGGSLVGGTTPVTGTCSPGQFLYNNAGILGCSASSATIALPQAVTGGVSGGVAYFSATTTMNSSALLAANALMVGGGAGVAPSTVTTGTGVVTALGVNNNTNGGMATSTTTGVVVGALHTGGGSGTAMIGLADVAVGSYLKSGGVTTIPAWQAFGAGVQAAVALAADATGGVALVNGSPVVGNCLKWSATGVQDNGTTCGGGGGTITAGTTPTSGFTAGQGLYSDGSLAQAAGTYSSANMSQQRNGVNPQAERIYNTYTDASNGEWGTFDWTTTANVLTIGTTNNGTGTARNINVVAGGVIKLDYGSGGNYWDFHSTSVQGIFSVFTGQAIISNYVTAPAFQASGTQPTITGAGGTCATTTKVGGATAGTVVLSGICASTNTIAFTGMPGSANGYSCDAEDRTTRTAGPFIESASTTTGFTLTVGSTSSIAADVLQWKCIGY